MAAPSGQSMPKTFLAGCLDLGARYWRSFLVAVIAAVFMSAIGAFDSHHLPPVQRLVYWLTMLLSGTVLGIAIMTLARPLAALAGRPAVAEGGDPDPDAVGARPPSWCPSSSC